MPLLRPLVVAVAALLTTACTSTASLQDRPMRDSEKTFLSEGVADRLAASETGLIDTRDEPEIRCERFKIVGSHMVHRRCFTLTEEENSEINQRDRMEQVMNRTVRPRSEVGL